MTTDVKEKLVDKLRKIKAMAESAEKIGNEEEANAFATMLQRLLAKHSLDMTDVEWDRAVAEETVATVEEWLKNGGQKFGGWVPQLAMIIAEANSCRTFTSGRTRVSFVGSKLATETAKASMDYMYHAARKFAAKAQPEYEEQYGKTRNFRTSYLMGFVNRLRERYQEEAAKIRGEYQSTALVRLNRSLVLADQWMNARKWSYAKSRLRTTHDGAYRAGVARANSLNIGGPVIKDANRVKLGGGKKLLN